MIKVGDINKSKETSSSGKLSRGSGSGASFASYLNNVSAPKAQGVSGAAGVSVTDAILSTQMVGSEEEKEIKKQLVKRGSSLLQKLEEIRDGLLFGEISKERLIEISRFVKDKKFRTEDARLQEIIEEIELRVEVEIAKLTR